VNAGTLNPQTRTILERLWAQVVQAETDYAAAGDELSLWQREHEDLGPISLTGEDEGGIPRTLAACEARLQEARECLVLARRLMRLGFATTFGSKATNLVVELFQAVDACFVRPGTTGRERRTNRDGDSNRQQAYNVMERINALTDGSPLLARIPFLD
jgi:hypothetical protein